MSAVAVHSPTCHRQLSKKMARDRARYNAYWGSATAAVRAQTAAVAKRKSASDRVPQAARYRNQLRDMRRMFKTPMREFALKAPRTTEYESAEDRFDKDDAFVAELAPQGWNFKNIRLLDHLMDEAEATCYHGYSGTTSVDRRAGAIRIVHSSGNPEDGVIPITAAIIR